MKYAERRQVQGQFELDVLYRYEVAAASAREAGLSLSHSRSQYILREERTKQLVGSAYDLLETEREICNQLLAQRLAGHKQEKAPDSPTHEAQGPGCRRNGASVSAAWDKLKPGSSFGRFNCQGGLIWSCLCGAILKGGAEHMDCPLKR